MNRKEVNDMAAFGFFTTSRAPTLVMVVALTLSVWGLIPKALAINIERWQAHGVPVFFVHAPEIPMVDLRVDFKGVTQLEPAHKAGLASMLQGQMLLANRQINEKALSEKLADVGAQMSGGTEADSLWFRLRLLEDSATVNAVLPTWLDLLRRPYFQARLLNRERQRAIADYRESRTLPSPVASRAFFSAVYGDLHYGRSATDTTLMAITPQDLAAFHRAHIVRGQAQITIVGAWSRARAEQWANTIALALPEGAPNLSANVAAPKINPAPTRPPSLASMKQHIPFAAQQAHLWVGLPFINRQSPDLFPLLVANYIIGGGSFESQLMKVVRVQNGLAYSVYSSFNPLKISGAWWMNAQTSSDQADRALALMEKVVVDFLRDGPTEEEINAAKRFLVNSYPLRFDSNDKILAQVATVGIYDLPLNYLDTWPANINAVTRESLMNAARRHFPMINAEGGPRPNWFVLVLGPVEKNALSGPSTVPASQH